MRDGDTQTEIGADNSNTCYFSFALLKGTNDTSEMKNKEFGRSD